MKSKVIIFCALLFCSKFVASIPFDEELVRQRAPPPSHWQGNQNTAEHYHGTGFARTHNVNSRPTGQEHNVNHGRHLENYGPPQALQIKESQTKFAPGAGERRPDSFPQRGDSYPLRTDNQPIRGDNEQHQKHNWQVPNRFSNLSSSASASAVAGRERPLPVHEPHYSTGYIHTHKAALHGDHHHYHPEIQPAVVRDPHYHPVAENQNNRYAQHPDYGTHNRPVRYENYNEGHTTIINANEPKPTNNGYVENPSSYSGPTHTRHYDFYHSAPAKNVANHLPRHGNTNIPHSYNSGHNIPSNGGHNHYPHNPVINTGHNSQMPNTYEIPIEPSNIGPDKTGSNRYMVNAPKTAVPKDNYRYEEKESNPGPNNAVLKTSNAPIEIIVADSEKPVNNQYEEKPAIDFGSLNRAPVNNYNNAPAAPVDSIEPSNYPSSNPIPIDDYSEERSTPVDKGTGEDNKPVEMFHTSRFSPSKPLPPGDVNPYNYIYQHYKQSDLKKEDQPIVQNKKDRSPAPADGQLLRGSDDKPQSQPTTADEYNPPIQLPIDTDYPQPNSSNDGYSPPSLPPTDDNYNPPSQPPTYDNYSPPVQPTVDNDYNPSSGGYNYSPHKTPIDHKYAKPPSKLYTHIRHSVLPTSTMAPGNDLDEKHAHTPAPADDNLTKKDDDYPFDSTWDSSTTPRSKLDKFHKDSPSPHHYDTPTLYPEYKNPKHHYSPLNYPTHPNSHRTISPTTHRKSTTDESIEDSTASISENTDDNTSVTSEPDQYPQSLPKHPSEHEYSTTPLPSVADSSRTYETTTDQIITISPIEMNTDNVRDDTTPTPIDAKDALDSDDRDKNNSDKLDNIRKSHHSKKPSPVEDDDDNMTKKHITDKKDQEINKEDKIKTVKTTQNTTKSREEYTSSNDSLVVRIDTLNNCNNTNCVTATKDSYVDKNNYEDFFKNKNITLDLSDKIPDAAFFDNANNGSMCFLYMFHVQPPVQPIIETEKETTNFANGTVVQEVTVTTWQNKNDTAPTITKTKTVFHNGNKH